MFFCSIHTLLYWETVRFISEKNTLERWFFGNQDGRKTKRTGREDVDAPRLIYELLYTHGNVSGTPEVE